MDKSFIEKLIAMKEEELLCLQEEARKATREAGDTVRKADRLQRELQKLREKEKES